MTTRKKVVHSSNLALRFYESDGWDLATLSKYLKKGSLIARDPGTRDSYFMLANYGRLDMTKLYENEVSKVFRAFDDYPEESDLEFMNRLNW